MSQAARLSRAAARGAVQGADRFDVLPQSPALPVIECYDTSHLYNLHHIWQEGLVRRRCSSRRSLEDSLWAGKGRLAESLAEQVRQVRKIIEGLGLEIATPDEARVLLQLKGADQVGF